MTGYFSYCSRTIAVLTSNIKIPPYIKIPPGIEKSKPRGYIKEYKWAKLNYIISPALPPVLAVFTSATAQ